MAAVWFRASTSYSGEKYCGKSIVVSQPVSQVCLEAVACVDRSVYTQTAVHCIGHAVHSNTAVGTVSVILT